jgi:hypothetical protein
MRVKYHQLFVFLIALTSICAAQSSSECKPVEHYGVKGCELLPDRTCPAGYHQQAVSPPDPRMAGPTHLMCVPDNPEPKKDKPKEQKPNSPEKGNR